MEYLKFLEQLTQELQKKMGGEAEISISSIMKTNHNKADTLNILRKGENMAPAIHIAPLYRQYCSGESMDAIIDGLIDIYEKSYHGGKIDLEFYTNFEKSRHYIACKLVNYEKNRYMLSKVPHRRFLDLAVVYYFRMDHAFFGKGSILIHRSHLELWNTDEEELHDIAISNTLRLFPYEIKPLADMVEEMTGVQIPMEERRLYPLYVITNIEKYFGAAAIIYDSVLEAIGEKLESNYYILPSSIHECLILPASESVQIHEIQDMVHEINTEQVEEGEVLSDSVYYYERTKKKLCITKKARKTD